MKRTRNKNEQLAILAGVLVLLLAGFKWSIALPQHMDILFGDEAEYMRNGMDLFKTIRNDWGPVYNMWYKFLSVFFHDTIQLYYANYTLGAIAVSTLLFISLCSFKFNKITALYVSFCFFVSSININTWPRISHFVLILVLIALIIAERLPSDAKKCLVFTILCYVCSYARPDLFFAFLILLAASSYFLYKERNNFKDLIPYLLVLIVAVLFFQIVFGFPPPTYKGGLNRLYSAFCQHYSMNYKFRTHAHFDAVTEWIDFSKSKFPDCATITDVLIKHPGDFFQNVFFNLRNYITILFATILSFIFPTGMYHGKWAMMSAVILFAMFVFVVLIHPQSRKQFNLLIRQHKFIIFLLLAFSLPSIGMSVIIFPRQHYILLHSVLILFLVTILLQSILTDVTFKWIYFIPLAIVLVIFSPTSRAYRYMQFGSDMDNLCEQKLIRFLRTKTDKNYVVFTNYLNVTYMLPKNYSEFSTEFELKRGMQFSSILKDKNINMILVSPNILNNPILMKDPTWNELIVVPGHYGFKTKRYSNMCESYLLIKE
ncbi:MAG: hypothetical protein JWN78_2706 [Bacteroidota bacterium]|nr:hypothetical protein [Bacteroidota bacterium]